MRVLVCGGRNYNDYDMVIAKLNAIHRATPISAIIYGMATGADTLGAFWAAANNVNRYGFPANWEKHGRAAGPIRNSLMLAQGKPDLVLAFPGNQGTRNMIFQARQAKIKVEIVK